MGIVGYIGINGLASVNKNANINLPNHSKDILKFMEENVKPKFISFVEMGR